jgi:agmatinase
VSWLLLANPRLVAQIRQASEMLCDATHPHFDVDLAGGAVGDAGDLVLPNTSLAAMRAALMPQAAALVRTHRMAWLGGDHSVTLPLLRALRAEHERPLMVVHFDAHCDTWTDHFGEPSGHGTWVHEALTEGLAEPAAFTQLGIRSAADRAARDYVAARGGRVYPARALRGLATDAALAPVLADVHARWLAADRPPVYLTVDIDCLDPAYAPGTGTPEPGGLTSGQLLALVEGLGAQLPMVGMDCVEVAPPYDHADLTSLAAAHVVWTWLCAQRAHHPALPPSSPPPSRR